jgi:hypothetical protein
MPNWQYVNCLQDVCVGENKNWFVMTAISGMSSNITSLPKHPAVKAHSRLGGK